MNPHARSAAGRADGCAGLNQVSDVTGFSRIAQRHRRRRYHDHAAFSTCRPRKISAADAMSSSRPFVQVPINPTSTAVAAIFDSGCTLSTLCGQDTIGSISLKLM